MKKKVPRGLSYPKAYDGQATGMEKFPFLLVQDPRNAEIFWHLSAMKTPPWEHHHKTTEAWNKLAKVLSSDKVTKENGEKLFPNSITGISIRRHVYDILNGFHSYHASATHCSGHENEPSDEDDFICCIEDVTSCFYEWERQTSNKRDDEVLKKAEKSMCEQVMHDVAAGNVAHSDVIRIAWKTSKDAWKRSSSSSPVSSLSVHDGGIIELDDYLSKEQQATYARVEESLAEQKQKALEIAGMKAQSKVRKL